MFINPNGNTLPAYRSYGIEQYLYRWAEQRACECALEEKAHGELEIERMWTLSTSEHTNALLEGQGFGVVRREVEMEIEMDKEPVAPEWPNGINARTLVVINDVQNIHRIIQNSFSELTGHCYQPFEQWEADAIHRKDFDPALVFVAETVGEIGEIVGVAMGYDSESGGWIRQVAVERQWRRRGIALQLVRSVLVEFYRRGTWKVGLSVDPQNVTGALRVYERAGMHVRRQYYTYDKQLDVWYCSTIH
jgi:ribosomal protein S18 acetylase RimI-like enzyme